jgi:hypothetical protein
MIDITQEEIDFLRAAHKGAERVLWLISGRSSTDQIMRESGLGVDPSQILARAWLEKYSTFVAEGKSLL